MVVELHKLVSVERVAFLTAKTKSDALDEMVDLVASADEVTDPERFAQAIEEREGKMSTGIGLGIAVPHAKIASVNGIVLAVGVSREGIEFDAFDDEPVHIIVMIAAPEGAQEGYIQVLATVAAILKKEPTRQAIVRAESPQEVREILSRQ